jgi:hypothetical protein
MGGSGGGDKIEMESLTYLFTLPLDPLPSREEKKVMGQTVQSFFF